MRFTADPAPGPRNGLRQGRGMTPTPTPGTMAPRPARRRLVPAVTLTAVSALAAVGCYSPKGSLDMAVGMSVGVDYVRVAGWAWDQDTTAPVIVQVTLDGAVKANMPANLPRPDVAAAYPGANANTGFDFNITTTKGPHTVCAVALDATGEDAAATLACRPVQVGTSSPDGHIDGATPTTAPAAGLRVTGWARDPDSTAPVAVIVKAD